MQITESLTWIKQGFWVTLTIPNIENKYNTANFVVIWYFLVPTRKYLIPTKEKNEHNKKCKKIVGRIYKSNTILRSKPSEWHGKPPLPWGEREEIVSPEQAILSCWTCFSISKGSWNKFRMTDNDKMAKWKNTSFWGASRRVLKNNMSFWAEGEESP